MEKLFQVIASIIVLNAELVDCFREKVYKQEVKKGNYILDPSKVSDKMFFVESGLIRGFYIKDGKDITTGFMREGDFALSPISFFGNMPPFEYLETVEDCSFYVINRENLQYIYDNFTEFNKVGRVLVEDYYVRSETRTHFIRMNTGEEKYTFFLKNYPWVANRVSNQHIASFIGVTPETLSRIRAKKR
jgi:CRP-like cAMP-binding protein